MSTLVKKCLKGFNDNATGIQIQKQLAASKYDWLFTLIYITLTFITCFKNSFINLNHIII